MTSLISSPLSTLLPSAWECVAPSASPARATKRELLALSRSVERSALSSGARTVLVTFQDRQHLTPASRAAYARLARAGAEVTAFARGLVSDYRPDSAGLRHVALMPGDVLAQEWDIVVLGPSPVAFVARDLDPSSRVSGPDLDRPFSWARTEDPVLVRRAAEALLQRVPAS